LDILNLLSYCRFRELRARTGEWILDFVNATSASGVGNPGLNFMLDTRTMPGNLLAYYVDSSILGTRDLVIWNATHAINVGSGGFMGEPGDPYNQFYRPRRGGEIAFSDGIQWTTPIPQTLNNQSH
jgi:hypothetical protein